MKSLDQFKEMVREAIEPRVRVDGSLYLSCIDCDTTFKPEPIATQSCPFCKSEAYEIIQDVEPIHRPSPSRWLN